MDQDIEKINSIITRSEAEILKRNSTIERKQNLIDQYNKRLEVMISAAGVSLLFYLCLIHVLCEIQSSVY